MSRRYSSGVKSTVGLRMLNPTLLTKMSNLSPNTRDASDTSAARDFGHDTSHSDPVTSNPRDFQPLTASSTSAPVRAQMCTAAPWLASDSTMARLLFSSHRITTGRSTRGASERIEGDDVIGGFAATGVKHREGAACGGRERRAREGVREMKYTPEALRASCDDGALAVEAKRRGHDDDDERREDRGRQGPGSRGLRAGGRG